MRATPHPVLSAAVLVLALGASSQAANPRDLSGTWVLNKDRSDTVDDRDRGKPKPGLLGTPGMGGNGPMGGAGVQGPLMGGRGVDPTLQERMRALAHIAFEAPEQLTITAEGDAFRVVSEDGHATTLTPDGSKKDELNGGLVLQRRSRWDKDKLVTEIKAKDGGGEVKHAYTREGDRLIVEATFDGEVAAKTEKLKFVYNLKE